MEIEFDPDKEALNLKRHGRLIRLPTEAEELAIRRGIEEDPDAREWTEADFAAARPVREVLSPDVNAALREWVKTRGAV
jgi:uncharacterized DUF497 family protein